LFDPRSHRRLPWIVAVLAMALALPGLFVGYQADDWFHLAVLQDLEPAGHQRGASEALFSFFDGEEARTKAMRDAGIVPWWVDLDIRASFWRPVTAWTHILDDNLARNSAPFAHLHSILWFGLLVLLATMLYRRVSHNADDLVDVVHVRFRRPLDDPRYDWLCTREGKPSQCGPPKAGEVLDLPAVLSLGGG
jgi:hypothetical protein